METAWILIGILALLIIFLAIFFVRKGKKEKRLTPLTSFALAFILAGIIFGDSRILGYSLMGIGIVLAVIDVILKMRKRR